MEADEPRESPWPARERRVLSAAAVALLAVAVAPVGAEHSRLCDVLTSFHGQALVASIALACRAGWRRLRWQAAVLAGLACWAAAHVLPYHLAARDDPGRGPALRVCLLNVFRRSAAHAEVRALIERERPDVVVLLEVDRAWMRALDGTIEGYRSLRGSVLGNGGMLVLSRHPLRETAELALSPKRWPNLRFTLEVDGRRVRLLCAHTLSPTRKPGKWEDRNVHLAGLAAELRRMGEGGDEVLLVADLNVAMWSPHFRRLVAQSGLRECRRGFGVQATWPAPLALVTGVPIDHVLRSAGLRTRELRTGPYVGSDHLPLLVTVGWAD